MFDKYIIVEDTFKRSGDGFEVGVRLPYYRGLGLSMIEAVDVTIDGQQADPKEVTLTVGGKTYPVAGMDEEYEAVWNFGEVATLKVSGVQPASGEHQVHVALRLRISYLPMKLTGQDTKTLQLVD